MEHLPSYVVDWDLSQAERGVEAFAQFMHAAGAKFEPSSDLQKLLEVYRGGRETPRYSPREMFEQAMMREGNRSLTASGDARRLFREVGEVRRWRLLTPEQAKTARANGMKLEAVGAPFRRAMLTFATIPVAIGTYFFAHQFLLEQGVEESYAWLLAIGAWILVRQTLNYTLLRAR